MYDIRPRNGEIRNIEPFILNQLNPFGSCAGIINHACLNNVELNLSGI